MTEISRDEGLQGIPILKIAIRSKVRFSAGGFEEKYRITGDIEDATGKHEVQLIERGGPNTLNTKFYSRAYFEKWQALRECGLPVVQNVWASESGTLYVTDEKADWSETYGKSLFRTLTQEVPELDASPRRRVDIDPLFKSLMDTQEDKIIAACERLIHVVQFLYPLMVHLNCLSILMAHGN